ncbi:MAG: hypothetical protein K0S71_296 [Clostridia bacterium]|jgi:hypothetical protein|nr:hypothetical protein [Clostridia bacterium]
MRMDIVTIFDRLKKEQIKISHGDIIGVDLGAYDTNVWNIKGIRPAMVVGEYEEVGRADKIKVIPLTKNENRNAKSGQDPFYAVPLVRYREHGTFGIAVVNNEIEIEAQNIFKLSWDGIKHFDDDTINEITIVRCVFNKGMSRALGNKLLEFIRIGVI